MGDLIGWNEHGQVRRGSGDAAQTEPWFQCGELPGVNFKDEASLQAWHRYRDAHDDTIASLETKLATAEKELETERRWNYFQSEKCGNEVSGLGGCGEGFSGTAVMYRCANCDVAFHKSCLVHHFGTSGIALPTQLEQLVAAEAELTALRAAAQEAMKCWHESGGGACIHKPKCFDALATALRAGEGK